ncbi:MAG: hypothetical protein DME23_23440 [Verrucomicrobia bacterium]|nr:MAG: hypothetical protein DME23_23440 [Verrucomicrobiota bacterium]
MADLTRQATDCVGWSWDVVRSNLALNLWRRIMSAFKYLALGCAALFVCAARTLGATDITLTFGTSYAGTISEPGEQVGFAFTGTVGQRLYYDTLDADFESIYISLISPSGTTIWQINHSSDFGPFTLAETGTYKLLLDATGDTLGDYSFRLLDLGAAPTLALGTTVTNQLSPRLETDIFQFSGIAGQRVNLSSVSASANQAQWRLIGPSNQQFVSGNIVNSLSEVVLPASGPYFVLIEGNTDSIVPLLYEFRASGVLDAPVAVTGLGSVLSGAIFAGQTNNSTFTAPAGLQIYLDSLDRGGGSLLVDLRDPSGALVFSTGETADTGPVTLPRSGTYSVNVRGNSPGATGLFKFRLLDLTSSPALLLNTNVTATLSNAYQTDVYQLVGSAGQRLYYDALDNDFDQVTARLISSDGAAYLGVRNSDSDFGPFTLTASGTNYLILESNMTGSPDYSFRLLDVGAAPALPLDREHQSGPQRGALPVGRHGRAEIVFRRERQRQRGLLDIVWAE